MSFSPTLGRWVSQDPIGFEARDSNLYRYENNNPINMVDPSGLAANKSLPCPEKLGTAGASIPNSSASFLQQLGYLSTLISRNTIFSIYQDQIVRPDEIPQQHVPNLVGPGQGQHMFYSQPNMPGQYFGTSGCQTCVALIIHCPRGCGAVFHFSTDDNPLTSVGQYAWPKGCKAIVAGGDDSAISVGLMAVVINAANAATGGNLVIADASSVYVGFQGQWFIGPDRAPRPGCRDK